MATVATLVAGVLVAAAPAQAATAPWWHLTTSLRPAAINPDGEGTFIAQAYNVGDAPALGPISLAISLPAGTSVVESEGVPQVSFIDFAFANHSIDVGPAGNPFLGAATCQTSATDVVCSTGAELEGEKFLPQELNPFEMLEVRVRLKAVELAPGGEVGVSVTGGGASPARQDRPLPVSTAPAPFGAEALSLIPEEEGGAVDTRAGSHPFQLTNTFNLNQSGSVNLPPGLVRNLEFRLPPGQLGNATTLPQCSAVDFSTFVNGSIPSNRCPADTAIGVAGVTFYEPVNLGLFTLPSPLFNLVPARGEPARFGFVADGAPIILDTSVRSSGTDPDYGVTVSASNITQLTNLMSSTVTFWGTPGDPRHDTARGWSCLAENYVGAEGPCPQTAAGKSTAFLTLPTNCTEPFATTVSGVSWPTKADPLGATLLPLSYSLTDSDGAPTALDSCNQVPFEPQIEAEPTSNAATSPTGLGFGINFEDPGLLNAEGVAQSQIKKAVITLPEGFTTNPSVAEGLKACPEGAYESTAVEGPTCPEESKIGEVEIESPLISQKVLGSLYVAKQGENPNGDNLLTVYLIARNAEAGILVRQALKVVPNPVTGQLTTEVDDVPQLPFSHFHLSFRSGQRSPLVTPPTCGTYTVKAQLAPWSNPEGTVERESSFKITTGPEGQGCPNGGVPPFHPGLEAGTINNAAGTYSPFYTHITRRDSEQEITRFSIKLPPGVIGKLAGVSYCPDAGIAAAKAREVEGGGTVEQEHPSCPANSEVGHSLVGAGVGNVLAYAPGKLYLAGPYHGSQLSLVSITAAKVGPFDLGTVVVRFALRIDPESAEVSVDGAQSDPIPHIVDGIPIHLRDIRAYVDRPNFTLNPTGCQRTSTAATVLGSGQNFASSSDDVPVTVSSPFQAADCASLKFGPKLALTAKGATKRNGKPKFKAVLTYPKGPGYSNIKYAQVTLPASELLEQSHLNDICTRVQFNAGGGQGEQCPKKSVYGKAIAVTPLLDQPLQGPVYLRSSSHKLPDLVAVLRNGQITIDLDGRIDSVRTKGSEVSRIRNTFEMVPDAPVSKFTLELQGGRKSLLVNTTNICKGTHKGVVLFEAHSGKLDEFTPPLKAECGKKGKGKKGGSKPGKKK